MGDTFDNGSRKIMTTASDNVDNNLVTPTEAWPMKTSEQLDRERQRAKEHAESVEARWKIEREATEKLQRSRFLIYGVMVVFMIVVFFISYYLFAEAPGWAIAIAVLQIFILVALVKGGIAISEFKNSIRGLRKE
ncbi:hypothetical protein ACO0LM_25135 [Undibacterium sp. Di26W]|uniref:hypothetical protein n=1 Tax=Undibacterium sp. Di26W TaxID=3413035 RepID=UPI003BEFA54D